MKKLTVSTLASAAVSLVFVLAYGLSSVAIAQDAKPGDKAAGEKKSAMCIGCHGIPLYQASFPEIHKVPMITGQNAKYIAAALVAYKKGDRKHPTMRGIAATLNEQDMADLAAYYEAQPKDAAALPAKAAEPSAKVAALVKKANCVSCHGENYSKPIDGSYPKLAGQHADYLYVALKAYQTEGKPQVGRAHAVMSGMAKLYTPAELKDMAKYIGSLDGELKTVAQSRFR
jgi:cytochrome c553